MRCLQQGTIARSLDTSLAASENRVQELAASNAQQAQELKQLREANQKQAQELQQLREAHRKQAEDLSVSSAVERFEWLQGRFTDR